MPPTPRDRPRPSKAELAAAAGRTIDDVIAPGLAILFVGINPGLWSGVTGFHFANPANRFWRAIHAAGLVDRVLDPSEQHELLHSGIGIVNLVPRTTASAAELRRDELREGGRALVRKVERYRPRTVAFLGISTYKVAFDASAIDVGLQPERLADARVWVLPNPSGLNASWSLPRLAEAYGALRTSR
jgi:double-stranded uracil-DNA glycosylase